MRRIHLGHDARTGRPVRIPRSSFDTHWHLIGGTGKGKTTAIIRMLHQLLLCSFMPACFIIIDRMGGFSNQLLMWMASQYCTDLVRRRLIYFEAGREGIVLPFNPLLYDGLANGHFKISRATEILLRGFESQNIEAMPRLARWVFNCFWSAAQLGLTISDCVHFLMPGSPLHAPLIACLPDRLRYEWNEITQCRNNAEISRMLESARNRLRLFFDNEILRLMFAGSHNALDLLSFMRNGLILIVNLAPQNRIPTQVVDTIGALIINEVLAIARSLAGVIVYPTYLWLDEFQRFVGPDLQEAIPEVRQLGLKLVLSHQSLSQLKRGDVDLSPLMFTAQSRMVFSVQGEDADTLAHEFATIAYDPDRVKQEIYQTKQRQAGYRIVELENWSESESSTESHSDSSNYGTNSGTSVTNMPLEDGGNRTTASDGRSAGWSSQSGSSRGSSRSHGHSQAIIPNIESFSELSSRAYMAFHEQRTLWAQAIRLGKTGTGLMRLVDDPTIYEVDVKRSAPGFLGFDLQTIHKRFPRVIDDTQRLIQQNFDRGPFCSPREIEIDTNERLERVLGQRIIIPSSVTLAAQEADQTNHPFA